MKLLRTGLKYSAGRDEWYDIKCKTHEFNKVFVEQVKSKILRHCTRLIIPNLFDWSIFCSNQSQKLIFGDFDKFQIAFEKIEKSKMEIFIFSKKNISRTLKYIQ